MMNSNNPYQNVGGSGAGVGFFIGGAIGTTSSILSQNMMKKGTNNALTDLEDMMRSGGSESASINKLSTTLTESLRKPFFKSKFRMGAVAAAGLLGGAGGYAIGSMMD